MIAFAGQAGATTTIRLLWGGVSDMAVLSAPASSSVVLDVVLAAGPDGVGSAAVTIDYSDALSGLVLSSFTNHAPVPPQFPLTSGPAVDTGTQLQNLNAVSNAGSGTGLPAGQDILLGQLVFHNTGTTGTFTVYPVLRAETSDGFVDLDGDWITNFELYPAVLKLTITPIPEPKTTSLLGLGLAGLAMWHRRRAR